MAASQHLLRWTNYMLLSCFVATTVWLRLDVIQYSLLLVIQTVTLHIVTLLLWRHTSTLWLVNVLVVAHLSTSPLWHPFALLSSSYGMKWTCLFCDIRTINCSDCFVRLWNWPGAAVNSGISIPNSGSIYFSIAQSTVAHSFEIYD